MDLYRRAALLAQLRPFGLDENPPATAMAFPFVTLDEFFTGNDDTRSLGPQIDATHPGMDTLLARLRAIAARPDVDVLLVQVRDAQWAYDSEDEWVSGNCVVVVTCAGADEVAHWRRELGCTAIAKGLPEPLAPNPPALREGYAAWQLVWT
ncbi:MAG: hypothetical protein JNN30_02900 [Rhodanobacteraceae bacterium]|nr:hypothetical protein [Rhodanobacteraceae bacterium]